MPSKPRSFAPGFFYHIYNRGSQKMTLFHTSVDYERFLLKAREYKAKYPLDVIAYCLMPNHFHFLIRPVLPDLKGQEDRPLRSDPTVSSFFQQLQNAYARYFSIKYGFSGRVFQGTYKSKLIDNDAYMLQVAAYIHDNPVKNGHVTSPEIWPYSSYIDLIGIRKDDLTTNDPNITSLDHKAIYNEFAKSRNVQDLKGLSFDP